jgi:hypothetical protein
VTTHRWLPWIAEEFPGRSKISTVNSWRWNWNAPFGKKPPSCTPNTIAIPPTDWWHDSPRQNPKVAEAHGGFGEVSANSMRGAKMQLWPPATSDRFVRWNVGSRCIAHRLAGGAATGSHSRAQ